MSSNPYQPPQSELPVLPAKRDLAWLTSTLGLLCVLPALAFTLLLVASPSELIENFSASPVRAVLGHALALASITSGGTLLALRPAAVPAFAIALAVAVAAESFRGFAGAAAWFYPVVFAVGLVYSLWLRARGSLRSRPNNSSKPTPLRGAA